jgi:hypothetical protein
MTAERAAMTIAAIRLSRRKFGLAFGGAVLGLAFAPQAAASPLLRFPLRIGYARVGRGGFLHIRSEEQSAWTFMQTRLGGLIDSIEPIQPFDMLAARAPDLDGGANCALVARRLASDAGFNYVILYATNDGQKIYASGASWVSRAFASLRAEVDKDERATGEAHLLDVSGGPAIASVMADAAPREPLNLFDNRRNPERETLTLLTQNLERRLQDFARTGYEAQRSIAD